MQAPLQAALPFIPPVTPPASTAPGPFAFADADRVRTILIKAEFPSVTINPLDVLIGGGDIEETLKLTLRVGPLGAALREHPELAEVVTGAVKKTLSAYVPPNGVMMPAANWIVQARIG
jgi:hypothetical protein